MPEQETNDEMTAIETKLAQIGEKIEKDFASKKDLQEMKDLVAEVTKQRQQFELSQQRDPVFGDKKTARDFVDCLAGVVENHPKLKHLEHGFANVSKAGLDATTDANGAVTVPTSVSNVLNILIAEYGKARQLHDVIVMQGKQDLPIASDDASAAYVADDTTAGADTKQTLSKATLSPKQFLAIYRASGNLIYNSAIDVAQMVATALVRAAGRLEDDTVWFGNGTTSYGKSTGYEAHDDVPQIEVASTSAVTVDDLIDLIYQAHESIDGTGEFYISRSLRPVLRKLKASTSGKYLIDIQGSSFEIDGKPVNTINRFRGSNATAGQMIALYGDPRQAGKIGVNRGMQIDLDLSVDFVKAGLVWRLLEDFSFAIANPKAVSRLVIEESSGS